MAGATLAHGGHDASQRPYSPDKELFAPEDLTAKLLKPPELNKKSRSNPASSFDALGQLG